MKAVIVALFLLGSTLGLYGQGSVSPAPILTFFTNAGAPCANCLLYTYVAGSVNTDLATYSNEGLTTELPNPITLNSAGRPTTGAGATTVVYLSQNSYKFVLTTAGGTNVWTADHVPAIPAQAAALDVEGTAGENLLAGEAVYLTDGSGSQTAGRWYKTDADNTYGSSTAGMVGVVPGNIDSGESGSIRLQGRITGLSALTAGAKYYASATAGGLTATPPTNARFIGEADSTTSIVVGGNPGAVRLPDSNGTHAAVMRITQNLTADRLWTVTWGDTAITTTFTPGASGTFLRTDGTNWAASTLVLPNAATTGDLPYASATSTVSMLASGATAGMYLRNGGASTAPLWSTLILPNAATANRIVYATATNTLGESAGLTFDGTDFVTTGDVSFGGGDLIATANAVIRRNTSDASDNGTIEANAGGATGSSRGGGTTWNGNEASAAGDIVNRVGNVADAEFSVHRSDGTEALEISGAEGRIVSTANIQGAFSGVFRSTNATSPFGLLIDYSGAAPNGTDNAFWRATDTGATRGELRSNGGLANFSANDVNLSDARTKDIFGVAPSQRSLFRRLQFVEARYLDNPTAAPDVMLTAQNVQTVYPELVTYFDPARGLLGVREHGVVMRGLSVVQELDDAVVTHEDRLNKQLDLIAGIEARLRALEAENADLRARLASVPVQ